MQNNNEYILIAMVLLDIANGNEQAIPKAQKIAAYLEQLARAAMEHAYPIDNYHEGMPLFRDVCLSFQPPNPQR